MKTGLNIFRPKAEYTKTDMANYTQLNGGLISSALLHKTDDRLMPLFSLITDKDSSVGSETEKRIDTITNKFYRHELGSDFDESIEELIEASVEARLFGLSICELFVENGNFAYRKLDRECFFYEEGKILLQIGKTKFEPKEPRYVIFRHKPTLLKTLWIVYAKHFVLSIYMKFAELLGIPLLVANISNSDDETIEAVGDILSSLKSAGYAVMGKEDTLSILSGRGSQDDFLAFVRYCDAEIAKVINANTLTSNVGSSGSLAQAQIHEKQRQEIVARDVKFAIRCVTKAFRAIELEPKLVIFYEEDKDLLSRATVLEKLHGMGFSMSVEDMSTEFDLKLIKEGKSPQSRLSINNRLEKNEKSKPLDNIDAFMQSENMTRLLDTHSKNIKKTLEEMLTSASSFEEAFHALEKRYPDMKMDELEELFTTLILNATLETDNSVFN